MAVDCTGSKAGEGTAPNPDLTVANSGSLRVSSVGVGKVVGMVLAGSGAATVCGGLANSAEEDIQLLSEVTEFSAE
jgi:hypothetical protein